MTTTTDPHKISEQITELRRIETSLTEEAGKYTRDAGTFITNGFLIFFGAGVLGAVGYLTHDPFWVLMAAIGLVALYGVAGMLGAAWMAFIAVVARRHATQAKKEADRIAATTDESVIKIISGRAPQTTTAR